MNLPDVEEVCRKMPDAFVIAAHLDSVNHALVTSSDVKEFAQKQGLTNLCVPATVNSSCCKFMKTGCCSGNREYAAVFKQ